MTGGARVRYVSIAVRLQCCKPCGESEGWAGLARQVAVVGTAHVRGILREWDAAGADWRARLDGLLADDIRAA